MLKYVDGSEIIGLSLKGMKLFVKDHKIHIMLSHGNHVWATSIQAGHKGSLLKFDGNKKDEYIEVLMKFKLKVTEGALPDGDYGISLACSDNHVYVGTISGWCLMFPTDVNYHTVTILGEKLLCHYIRSLVVVKIHLYKIIYCECLQEIKYFLLIVPTLNLIRIKKDIMLIGGLEHFYCHLMKKLCGLCILMDTPFLHGTHKNES